MCVIEIACAVAGAILSKAVTSGSNDKKDDE